MCDCYEAPCAASYCHRMIPVHISNGCLPRDRFSVRCHEHAPPQSQRTRDGWVRFIVDKRRQGKMGREPLLDIWMRRIDSNSISHCMPQVYDVGDENHIHPNTGYHTEAPR